MTILPDKWVFTPLVNCGEWGSGGTPKRTNPLYYQDGTIPWLIIGDLNDGVVKQAATHITESGLRNSSAKLLPVNTLLIAMYGSIGKLGITGIECATNQAIAFCKPYSDLVVLKYLFYVLMSSKEALLAQGQGGAQQNISQTILKAYNIPLAPLPEQKRIADKLNILLKKVDSCQSHLERVPQILKRFRQSVLAEATSGRLTKEWREENYIEDDWKETDVQSVAIVGTGSTPLRSNSSFYSKRGTPWVTSGATSETFITGAKEFVTDEAIKAHRLKLFPVGTLIVAMYGEGKTRGQVSELAIDATINQACAAIVVDETKVVKNYVKLALQANYLEMREMAEGGNQPNLNLTKIKEFRFPLPSKDKQHEIVRRVERLFAFVDRLEARWQAGQILVEKLTSSLLAKAFRGELVEQDPSDEPASVLLERIRVEREKAQAEKKKIKKTQKPKKSKEKKMTEDTVKDVIRKLPEDTFSFDELREKIPGDYEQLKSILFNLLSEDNPVISQIFDKSVEAMRFVRRSE